MPASNIWYKGAGFAQPEQSGAAQDGGKLNRRVEVIVN
jgi:outer membrane protein OmpA-like peptidoglycan-associated protein